MALPDYRMIGDVKRIAVRGKHSTKWYQCYRLDGDPVRKVRRAPCCRDRLHSRRKAREYIEQHLAKSLATKDPAYLYAGMTIAQHLEVWLETLKSDGKSNYARKVGNRIKRMNRELRWTTMQQIEGLKLKAWVAKQQAAGMALKTARDYLSCYKSFLTFLCINRRLRENPLEYAVLSVKGDQLKAAVTRKRRCITQEEFARLLVAAKNGPISCRLSGEQRVMLYLLTASTGFRAHEMASISPNSFSLDGDRPTVMIDCTISKRRRYDVQELQEELAEQFRQWLADKPADTPLWPGWWFHHAARMLRQDLKAAGIDYETDDGVIDFHAVGRVHFITNLVSTNSPLTLVQRIARLSTPALLDRYYRPSDTARTEAINAMPSLLPEVSQ